MNNADRALHKRLAAEVKAKLEAKGKSTKGVENFEAFYEILKKEALVLQKEYQPKLRNGINIAVDLINKVQQDKKDGDVDIRVRIAPNSFEITSAIVFKGNENKECRVESIQEIDNRSSDSEKFENLMQQWTKPLGIGEQMEDLSDDNRKLVRLIREQDKVWSPTQGFIYVPHIIEQRNAVERLSDEAPGTVALLGVERGGGMLAQQIEHENKIIVEHQYGPDKYNRIRRRKSLEAQALINELQKVAESNGNTPIVVSIAETVVGGGSATGLSLFLEGFAISQVIKQDGISGAWEHLKEQFSDLRATIMDSMMSMQR